jgi:putative hemolysin
MMQYIYSIPVILIFLFILAALSFFFSASETAIIGLSRIRLRHMIAKGIKRAQNIQRLFSKIDKFIAAILIGNDFMNIAISAIVTAIFVHIFGYHWGVIFSTFISTFFVLILCEITPKILATKHAEKIALFTAPVMEVFIKIFYPLILIFTKTGNFIIKIFGLQIYKRSPIVTEEELRLMIEIGKEEGVLSEEERKMLHRIFEFGDIKVGDVMVPKDKIIAVDITTTAEKLLDIFVEEGHARLPVYEGTIERITGIIYARDLLYTLRDKGLFVIQDLIHAPYYVSPSLKVNELLRKFQADKLQIAVVVNDKQKTLGLVTLEDLIEEIVGEIEEGQINHTLDKN